MTPFSDRPSSFQSASTGADLSVHRLALAGRTAALASLLAEDHRWLMVRGVQGRTALHCAALAGSVGCIKVLLFRSQYLHVVLERPASLPAEKALQLERREHFIDTPEASQGWTALFCAIASGSTECIDVLLQAGANPNYRCFDRTTPLAYAQAAPLAPVVATAAIRLLGQYGGSL